ncbi:hypothetical protein [Halosimplex sp. J119]
MQRYSGVLAPHQREIDAAVATLTDDVVDIFGPDRVNDHELTRFAVLEDSRGRYPPGDE